MAALGVFIPTFMAISLMPGMCMILSMSLGMAIGVRKTLWMMLGEVTGVALVAFVTIIGVASIVLTYPELFNVIKGVGGLYLCFVGVQMIRSSANKAFLVESVDFSYNRWQLAFQGFITAVSNPKGWAFFVAFLPPFIPVDNPLGLQSLSVLVAVITIEFCSLLAYAAGGKLLVGWLKTGRGVQYLYCLIGGGIIMMGLWMIFG